MVEYTEFIELGHDVFQAKGGSYDDTPAPELVQTLAGFWQRNKDELKTIGRREARRVIERQMNV